MNKRKVIVKENTLSTGDLVDLWRDAGEPGGSFDGWIYDALCSCAIVEMGAGKYLHLAGVLHDFGVKDQL